MCLSLLLNPINIAMTSFWAEIVTWHFYAFIYETGHIIFHAAPGLQGLMDPCLR